MSNKLEEARRIINEVDAEMAENIAYNSISLENDPQIQAAVAKLQGK